VAKVPESVLVVVYTPALDVLVLERADHAGFWQSVTGSRATADEALRTTCVRELAEETGLTADPEGLEDWQITHRYEIYPHWRHRYAPGVTHNVEHVFGFCVPQRFEPVLHPAARTAGCVARRGICCFSWICGSDRRSVFARRRVLFERGAAAPKSTSARQPTFRARPRDGRSRPRETITDYERLRLPADVERSRSSAQRNRRGRAPGHLLLFFEIGAGASRSAQAAERVIARFQPNGRGAARRAIPGTYVLTVIGRTGAPVRLD
jgi:dATP pyrophosphohydrolase